MADISELLNSISSNNQIPDNIKELFNNLKNENLNSSNSNIPSDNSTNNTQNFDLQTFLKFKTIFNEIKNSSDSSEVVLLKSLKPFLNTQRQNKIDTYIQFLNLNKYLEIFKQLGGDLDIGQNSTVK